MDIAGLDIDGLDINKLDSTYGFCPLGVEQCCNRSMRIFTFSYMSSNK